MTIRNRRVRGAVRCHQRARRMGWNDAVLIINMTSMEAFVHELPKIELHAHINGCVRESTLRELCQENTDFISPSLRSLEQGFEYFAQIHAITTHLPHVERITREAIEDFAKENVIYVELRTTPKTRPEKGVTKETYMEAVLAGRHAFYEQHPDAAIIVRLLLSIDRRESAKEAMETVHLARRLQSQGIVGIDLSGDPLLGRFEDWKESLSVARSAGLKLTFHAGEVVDPAETRSLVHFCPDRLGHAWILPPDVDVSMKALKIPVEICLTSNLVTQFVTDLKDHHLIRLYREGHPVVICTDDPGVFSTTLSREVLLAVEILGLSAKGVYDLMAAAIDYCFCDAETKAIVRKALANFERTNACLLNV